MQLVTSTEDRQFRSPTFNNSSRVDASARVRLRLFGRFSLTVDQRDVAVPHQLSRIIAFLARNLGHKVSRDRLASFYWGDMPTHQARRNLRVTLSRLRRIMAGGTDSAADNCFILATHNAILVPEDAPVWVDANEFERLVAVDGFVGLLSPERLTGLKEAMELYRGDLLPELEDEWVTVDREHLWERWQYALRLLILHACEADNYSAAIRWATTILRAEPSEELMAMLLMRLLILQGYRARAVKVYRELAGELRREFGMSPSQESQDLVRAITDDSSTPVTLELNLQEVRHYLQLARE